MLVWLYLADTLSESESRRRRKGGGVRKCSAQCIGCKRERETRVVVRRRVSLSLHGADQCKFQCKSLRTVCEQSAT